MWTRCGLVAPQSSFHRRGVGGVVIIGVALGLAGCGDKDKEKSIGTDRPLPVMQAKFLARNSHALDGVSFWRTR